MTKRDEIHSMETNRLMTDKIKKKQQLRNNEYYGTQTLFDDLYHKSKYKNNYKFRNLVKLIISKQNVELAYRNIKSNTGSNTSGVNQHTIKQLSNKSVNELHKYILSRIENFNPHSVRRVEIPKANGKTRPLGIPTIEDRLIQQCIKQILEPICEGKFYNHSYGFRPNRSTHHAVSRVMYLANRSKMKYAVDIDIKGFFDNVDHGKLLKQLWSLGIQDKRLISIISKILKAPIEGIGIPNKGTPQGGILSPLLSNIVLNELDWWVANQWEYFKTTNNYEHDFKGKAHKAYKYKTLRNKTKLKEIYIVRYADDFKILCKDHETAKKIFIACKKWLKERLHLDISEEKSKIVNLKKDYSEFLGFKLKLHDKGNKKVIKSHISDKAKANVKAKLQEQIKEIQRNATIKSANKYNSLILGFHNYYKIATNVNVDFKEISYIVNKSLENRTKNIRNRTGRLTECYVKYYGKYNLKKIFIQGVALFPIAGVTNIPGINFQQDVCDYTVDGRDKIHKKQNSVPTKILRYLLENPISSQSVQFNDNRLSLYVGQNGICPISKHYLEIGDMECHHKIPKSSEGSDEYSNLIFIKTNVHKLIHATKAETIIKYKQQLSLDQRSLKKLNELRILSGNFKI